MHNHVGGEVTGVAIICTHLLIIVISAVRYKEWHTVIVHGKNMFDCKFG